MPTLLTTYANSVSQRLPKLEEEDSQVFKTLMDGMMANRYLLFRESYVTADKLGYYLRLLRDDLWLFHFSGHAGQQELVLEDKTVGGVGVLALIEACPNLKLVVLNGCSTGQLARALHTEGKVPVVIGTTAPVEDGKAQAFSKVFYDELARGKTVKAAFDAGLAQVKYLSNNRNVSVYRDLGVGGEETEFDTFEWWLLGEAAAEKLVLPQEVAVVPEVDFEPNLLLLNYIRDHQGIQATELNNLRDRWNDGDFVDPSEIAGKLIECLPIPVGEPLRKLLCPVEEEDEGYDKISHPRLKMLSLTYTMLMDLLCFSALAELFRVLREKPELRAAISADLLEQIKVFLQYRTEAEQSFAQIHFINQLKQFLEEKSDGFFLGGLEALNFEEDAFVEACAEMEFLHLRVKRHTAIANTQLSGLCERGERSLAVVLDRLGFLAEFTLVAVNNIDIVKYAHQDKASYTHEVVYLLNTQGKVYPKGYNQENYMDNRSVLLLKGRLSARQTELPDYLNLSPFILDQTAFLKTSGDVSSIHFLDHYAEDKIFYRYLNKPGDKTWDVSLLAPGQPTRRMNTLEIFQKERAHFIREQFNKFLDVVGLNQQATAE